LEDLFDGRDAEFAGQQLRQKEITQSGELPRLQLVERSRYAAD